MSAEYSREASKESTPVVMVLDVSYLLMKNFNYLITDPATGLSVIVDPAWEMEKIDRALTDTQSRLAGILITHTHFDHIHLAKPLSEKYDCPVWMSKEEIAASGFSTRRLVGIDGPWRVGEMLIQPLLTPGHTPGCVCYLIADNLFTGDVLFAEGCGMCSDIPSSYAMFESLEQLKSMLKPDTRVYPGHSYGKMPGQIFSQLLRDNIYLQFSDKESFAAFRLRPGQSKFKIFNFS